MPFFHSGTPGVSIAVIVIVAGLSACQSADKSGASSGHSALATMERVAVNANTCWFKSGDATFQPYRLAPELNSFSGRPRILAVPRNSPESRPALVVQAEGSPARLDAFGPMMSGPAAGRIRTDVVKWANGATGC